MLPLLVSCSFFGGNDEDPLAYQPPGIVDFQVGIQVARNENPRVDRLVLDIAIGDSLSAPNHISSFDEIATVIWRDLPGESPAAVRVKGYLGDRWVGGATWSGYLPHSRDSAITLRLHPVYENLFSPLDTMPQLQDLRVTRLAFTLLGNTGGAGEANENDSAQRPALGISWSDAALVDSASEAQNPGRAHAVLYGDTLYATDRLRLMGVTSYPTEGAGTCSFMELRISERAGYQTLTSLEALRSRWQPDSAKAYFVPAPQKWVLVREEDHAYLLHTLAAELDPGNGRIRYEWEVYRFQPN